MKYMALKITNTRHIHFSWGVRKKMNHYRQKHEYKDNQMALYTILNKSNAQTSLHILFYYI